MRIEVTVDGHKRVLDTTRAVDRELVKGIRDAVRTGAKDLRAEARRRAPSGPTGNLRQAVRFRTWSRFLSATVFVDKSIAPHRHLVIHGRGPGLIPSAREGTPIAIWAKRHGINPWALARAMARHGTRPRPNFMREAFAALQEPIATRIRQAFEQAVRRGGRG